MRRKDREITDPALIADVIKRSDLLHIGFYDEKLKEVYVLPVNFGPVETDRGWVFYFHGAKAGRKRELIAENPSVGFEMETRYKMYSDEGVLESDGLAGGQMGRDAKMLACSWATRFESVIGTGTVSVVEDREERMKGFAALMQQVTGRTDWKYEEAMLKVTRVYKLTVKTLSCKKHD